MRMYRKPPNPHAGFCVVFSRHAAATFILLMKNRLFPEFIQIKIRYQMFEFQFHIFSGGFTCIFFSIINRDSMLMCVVISVVGLLVHSTDDQLAKLANRLSSRVANIIG